ncbi:MAG: hypothetical protein NT030_06575 [Candidatus Saganbacteria bacterium]|nr:hypothetical protein [Candidatus Saganbacteria bacterium]
MLNVSNLKGGMMFRILLSAVLATLLLSGVAFASPATDKIDVQRALETNVSQVLTSVLGHSNFVVSIDATLNTAYIETLRETWQANKNSLPEFSYMLPMPVQEKEMLPGVPAQQDFNLENKVKGNTDNTKITTKSLNIPANVFKKLSVTVLVDKAATAEEVAAVKKVVPIVLGINPGRGDQFFISRVALNGFGKAPALSPITSLLNSNLPLLLKYLALFILIAGIILVFFNRLKDAALGMIGAFNEGKEDEHLKNADKNNETNTELGKNLNDLLGENKEGEEEENKRFSYISDENIVKLKHILIGEDPSIVSTVLLNIDPKYSERLLSELPDSVKEEAIIHMTRPKEFQAGAISEMQDTFKVRLENVVGGLDEFINMFNQVDEVTGKQMLKVLEKKHPEAADQVRKMKFHFDDLSALADRDLQTVLSHVRPQDIAIALRGTDEATKNRILGNVSEESKEIINQWDELTPVVAGAKIEEAKRSIVKAAKKLDFEGGIIIKREKIDPNKCYAPMLTKMQRPLIEHPAQKDETEKPVAEPKKGKPEIKKPKSLSLISFDELGRLSDRDMNILIKEIGPKILTLALINGDGDFDAKIKEVSPEIHDKIQLYAQVFGRQPDSKVEDAKQHIVKKALDLNQNGFISLDLE